MQRIVKVELDLNKGLKINSQTVVAQCDYKTQFLEVTLKDQIDWTNKQMVVNFILPTDEVVAIKTDEPTQTTTLEIPTNATKTVGKCYIEISIRDKDTGEVITSNQLLAYSVVATVAGQGIEPEMGAFYVMSLEEFYKEIDKTTAEALQLAYDAKRSLEEYLITAENGGNAEFLQGHSPVNFNRVEPTISALVNSASNKYKLGDVVEVLGYYEQGDGAGHKRKASTSDDGSGVLGSNGLWWNIVHSGEVNVSWFGAKDTLNFDNREAFQKSINYSQKIIIDSSKIYEFHTSVLNQNGKNVCLDIKKDNFTMEGTTQAIDGGYLFYKGQEIDAFVFYNSRGLTVRNIQLDGNHKTIDVIANRDGAIEYSPYGSFENVVLERGIDTCMNIESFVASFTKVICNGRGLTKKGIVYRGIQSEPTTSTVFQSCYVQQCTEIGFDIFFTTYSSLISCAVDHVKLAYKLSAPYGVGMYSCGAEVCEKAILFDSWRGVSINNFYGLAIGMTEGEQDYLIEFAGGGTSATINGVRFEQSKNYKYKFGMTGVNFGGEFVNILDNSLTREECYFLTSSWDNKRLAVKFSKDFVIRDITETASSFEELLTVISKYKDTSLFGDIKIILNPGDYTSEYGVSLDNVRNIKIIADGNVNLKQRISLENSEIYFENINMQIGGGSYSNAITLKNSKISLKNCNIVNDGNVGAGIFSSGISEVNMNNSYVNGRFSNSNVYKAYHNEGIVKYTFQNITIKNGDYLPENFPVFPVNDDIISVVCLSNSSYNNSSVDWYIQEKTTLLMLDTPYYTTKMQSEGVYADYVSYRDELHTYEQEQKLIEQQRQEAYQQALEENPELTYENWLSTQPMQMSIMAEPQPSVELIAFKEKWLG